MTHKTGPRPEKVDRAINGIERAIFTSGVTISEACLAMHEVQSHTLLEAALEPHQRKLAALYRRAFAATQTAQIALLRAILMLFEDVTCPTCPPGKKRRRAR